MKNFDWRWNGTFNDLPPLDIFSPRYKEFEARLEEAIRFKNMGNMLQG